MATPTQPNPLLNRFRALTTTISTPSVTPTALTCIIDPCCSRSFISQSTLSKHFPQLIPTRAGPMVKSIIFENEYVKTEQRVEIPVIFRDMLGEQVELSAEVRISESRELDRSEGGDKVVLGMDWWARKNVVPVWVGQEKEEFVGIIVGERKVRCLVRNI